MKRIINFLLILGTIVSVFIALKYSALPVPTFFPDVWSTFLESSLEEQQKYVLLYDIAVGFILSALFYFVVEEIPDKVRLYKAKRLVRPQINHLLESMEQIISVVIEKYDCNESLKELAQKDFLILDGETKYAAEEISYKTILYYVKSKKRKTAVHKYGTIDSLVKSNAKKILDNIATIKNYEYFYASNVLLVECIRRIESCDLIRFYMTDDKKNNTPCFLLHGTSTAMIDLINLYLELLKCKFHTEYSVTSLDNIEETKNYRIKRETGELLQIAIDSQTKKTNTALTNPTAVVSGSKYTSKIFVSQLKRHFLATYISVNDLNLETLNSFKYIIFIIDSDTKDIVIHALNKNSISSGILLITEQVIFKKGIKDKIRNKNDIITEMFFKTAFKISHFPIVFSKQEPSEKSIIDVQHKIESMLYETK